MKTSEIKDFVSQLEKTKTPRTILIDGPWGCGKTTQALRCVTGFDPKPRSQKSQEITITREIFYISVFDFSSVSEMREALIRAQHEKAKTIGKKLISVFRMVTPFVSTLVGTLLPLPTVIQNGLRKAPDIAEAVLDTYTKDPKRDVIIIIDDIERARGTVSLMDILGFIDGLKASGNSVICLGNSNQFQNEDEKERWNDFKEKCFDRECVVDDIEADILTSITGVTDSKTISALQKIIEKNYRMAERATFLAETIEGELDKIAKAEGKNKKLTVDELLLNCAICCRSALGSDKERYKRQSSEGDEYTKVVEDDVWKKSKDLFGKKTANNLSHYFYDDSCRIEQTNDDCLFGIVKYYYYNHKEDLDILMEPKEKEEQPKTVEEIHPFFYGDAKRLECKEKFLKSISDGSIINTPDLGLRKFEALLSLRGEASLTDSEIETYSKMIIENLPDNKTAESILDNDAAFDQVGTITRLNERAQVALAKANDINRAKKLMTLRESGSYRSMCALLDDVKRDKELKREIGETINVLRSNDFLIPDMTDDIEYESWGYVHAVCDLAKANVIDKKDVLNVLKKQLDTNPTKCGKERLDSLTNQYGLDKDDIF